MRTARIFSIALAGTLLTGTAAVADDHEERYGPLVVGEESKTGEGWKDLQVLWEWEHEDGTSTYVDLILYDYDHPDLWAAAATGTCTEPDVDGERTCTTTAQLAEHAVPRDQLVVDRYGGQATFSWATTQRLADGAEAPCTIDVTATFEPDDREPTPSSTPNPRLRDGRVELRRSGGVWGYGEGSATGTICGWELDSARSRDWSLVHYSQYRTDTTYAKVRPEA